jgi:hypothetical protein
VAYSDIIELPRELAIPLSLPFYEAQTRLTSFGISKAVGFGRKAPCRLRTCSCLHFHSLNRQCPSNPSHNHLYYYQRAHFTIPKLATTLPGVFLFHKLSQTLSRAVNSAFARLPFNSPLISNTCISKFHLVYSSRGHSYFIAISSTYISMINIRIVRNV